MSLDVPNSYGWMGALSTLEVWYGDILPTELEIDTCKREINSVLWLKRILIEMESMNE